MSRIGERSARIIILSVVVLIIAAVATIILPQIIDDTTVKLADGQFHAHIAKTEEQRQKGLSGISTLSSNQALLMVFPTSGRWQIWMKDMKIPIDIVWLDSDKEVIYIVEDALPKSSTKVLFSPPTDAKYVIELSAGSVVSKAIKVGQSAAFDDVTQGVN